MAKQDLTETALQDELLEKMIGKWRISRKFANRTVENDTVVTWELEHHYLCISMTDVETPVQYAALVYISYERDAQHYTIHWLDTTAGSSPAALGYGKKDRNSIRMEWSGPGWELVNTFTWNEADDTWTSKIEQTTDGGAWNTFCVDTYSRVP